MNKLIFSLLCICLWLPLASHAQEDPRMIRGKKALRTNKFDRALAEFDALVKQNPRYPQVYVYRGLAYYALEKFFNAEVDFQRALDQGYRDPSGQVYANPQLTAEDAAKVYNNRGMSLYFLGQYEDASQQFREAYVLDANLKVAEENYKKARDAMRNPKARIKPGKQETTRSKASSTAYAGLYRDSRPRATAPFVATPSRDVANQTRDQRLVAQNLKSSTRKSKVEPFKGRRLLFGRKVYRNPSYQAATQSYVKLESIEINKEQTVVTLLVKNPGERAAKCCIAPTKRRESFFLTDRSGRTSGRILLQGVIAKSIEVCRDKTEIAPGQTKTVILSFDPIPSDVGYISLIEGNRDDGNEWNFYDIDLTD